MTILEYVVKNHLKLENWVGEDKDFESVEELLEWMPMSNCPPSFIDGMELYRPIDNGADCRIAKQSERQQRKVCTQCWNRVYANPKETEYETYLRLKKKFEKEKI
jgi:hypothetical protein